PGTVGILEDERPVERAELAVVAAQRGDLDGVGQRGGGETEGAKGEQDGSEQGRGGSSHGQVSLILDCSATIVAALQASRKQERGAARQVAGAGRGIATRYATTAAQVTAT